MYDVRILSGSTTAFDVTDAFGLNAKGNTAGAGYENQPSGAIELRGLAWNVGSVGEALPHASESLLFRVNASQVGVGLRGHDNSPTQVAIRFHKGTMSDLPLGPGSIATGINDAGLICGWSWNEPRAFVFDSASGVVSAWIDPLPGASSCGAQAINAQGEVAGLCENGHAFLHGAGGVKDLGAASFVADLNEAGQVCGSLGRPFPQNFMPGLCAAREPSPAFVELPVPPGFLGGHADGINAAGDVVGTCWTEQSYNGPQSAFLYRDGVSTDLNTRVSAPGWHLESAADINDHGQIVGRGTFEGRQVGYLLTPRESLYEGTFTLPELVATLLGGVTVDGGGWAVVGGKPRPVDPWGPWTQLAEPKRDALLALAMDELAMMLADGGARAQVRGALLEAARGQLEALLTTRAQGRALPAREAGPARRTPALKQGRTPLSLVRFSKH
ncbi:hypothetical protein FGE12_14050 [Aggregicoccus sp. 17bor-14]|uniref:hypothetical protein n=1 Tax=Myxococcaceae TaxID=31 RepID=UPI00129C8FEC|nr:MULTISPECIES: hypothetical protein [Myxococcaceae]MBF5043517.1 hypothetical protein [Simulacricoccus sp. 17bor-14]MRI89274.1 hypothetical protein [Aggregicoccus sp. 17bor-14]